MTDAKHGKRRLRRRACAAMGVLAAALGCTAAGGAPADPQRQSTVAFVADPTIGDNPERGFYRPARTTLERLTRDDANDAFAHGYRLLYVRIDLGPYRDSDLPAPFLQQLNDGFAAARAAGLKLIVRATYNYPRGETDYKNAQDAALPRVLAHIRAVGELLRRNVDVVAFVQAGYVGAWGEWHTSSHDLTTVENRGRIKVALLDAMPKSRFVQFRYPPYIREWAPTLPGLPDAMSGAFRIGFHNDCFLASRTDVGTFSADPAERAKQRSYAGALGALAPFGAETCNPADETGATARSRCADILGEGAQLHLSYLNDVYYRPLFHERWVAGHCMDRVRAQMGYRFELQRMTLPRSTRPSAQVPVTITIRNTGWARAYNPRPVELLLRSEGGNATHRLALDGVDPRAWLPGETATAHGQLRLPADLPAGRYAVLLAFPDPAPSLRNDPRYAIRPANRDARAQHWVPQSGAFTTGATLIVHS